MVLQRDKPINVWGWAEPGEDVKVTLGAASASTKAGAYRIGTVPQQGLRRKPYIPTGNDVEIEGGFRGERGIFLCWVPGLRVSKPSAPTASTPTNPAARSPLSRTASSGCRNCLPPIPNLQVQIPLPKSSHPATTQTPSPPHPGQLREGSCRNTAHRRTDLSTEASAKAEPPAPPPFSHAPPFSSPSGLRQGFYRQAGPVRRLAQGPTPKANS